MITSAVLTKDYQTDEGEYSNQLPNENSVVHSVVSLTHSSVIYSFNNTQKETGKIKKDSIQ